MVDAGERITLLQTYLALAEFEKGATPEERLLMLTQVFRHANTGVYDDAAPETPIKPLSELAIRQKT